MSREFATGDENIKKSRARLSDPMADQKRKARQRLVGSIFFSLFVFFLCLILLRDEPRSFVQEVIVEEASESESIKKIEKDVTVLNQDFNLSLRDKRIIELSNMPVWMVRVGVFEEKNTAQKLKDRLIAEGMPTIIIPGKIGNMFVFYVKVGPLKQESAEKFRRQALSRGLDADIDRL